ncbi:hypothetical protein D9M68_849410 [compost metagenome]
MGKRDAVAAPAQPFHPNRALCQLLAIAVQNRSKTSGVDALVVACDVRIPLADRPHGPFEELAHEFERRA